MGHSRPLFFYFRLFYKQLTVNKCSIKVANDWIRTQVLWCRKRPLCQLRHNHFPLRSFFVHEFSTYVAFSSWFISTVISVPNQESSIALTGTNSKQRVSLITFSLVMLQVCSTLVGPKLNEIINSANVSIR